MKKSDIRNRLREDFSMNEDSIEGFIRCWDFTKNMTKFSDKELFPHLQDYETSKRIHKKIADLENEIQLLKSNINELIRDDKPTTFTERIIPIIPN